MDITRPADPTLFLVDGYALIYRAFFALLSRPLRTARGENTSAAWGVVNFLQRLRSTHNPTYIAWVHDAGSSFRKDTFAGYKATREKLSEELQADFDQGLGRIEQVLAAYRVPIVTVDGYEADDVIGTLARKGVAAGLNVVIISGDKDFQQLVREGVWLLNPGRGGPAAVDEHWVGTANASERLGVPPEHVVDYLALVGDSSDNVPGVPGIGDKTARELVGTYGDLEHILAAAPQVKGKRAREALLAHPDRARMSRKLVTIRDDVPVEIDLPAFEVKQPDVDALRAVLIELEFTTLLRDLGEPDGVPVSDSAPLTQTQLSNNLDALTGVVAAIRAAGTVALQVHTVPDRPGVSRDDPLRSRLVGLSLSSAPGTAWYLPFAHHAATAVQSELLEETVVEAAAAKTSISDVTGQGNLPPLSHDELRPLRELLTDPSVSKITHNDKFVRLILRQLGLEMAGTVMDVMLASYLLDPGRRSHALDLLAMEFLGAPLATLEDLCGKGKDERPYDVVMLRTAADFAGAQAEAILRLRDVFEPQLESHRMVELLHDIELPLSRVLADMEQAGVSIDLAWFHTLKLRFQAERQRIERAIYDEAGSEFNINSPAQLRVILFERLGLPVRKKTASGPSTDASVLQELAEEGHVLPSLLMEYREVAKLESTYLDTLPGLVHPSDGRLHTSFNQTVAATGRLSSSDPNLQNIPVRRELGRDIRRGFIARPGWTLLVADYSQVELRLLAHLSSDPAFVSAFVAGGDIHRQTAALIFGVSLDEVTAEMRARAKTINFATIYGQGPHALARQLRITHAEAREFIEKYFARFEGVKAYLDSQISFGRENGFVETIFHRRRYIPELRDRNFNVRSFGERVAANAPIQGSAADLIKVAMIRIHEGLLALPARTRMILQVHDELVLEGPGEELPEVREMVRREMEGAVRLSVPLVVDLGIGDNWLDAKS